jgi:uncharacterized protein DUF4386
VQLTSRLSHVEAGAAARDIRSSTSGRILGFAFLLQAITSLASGLVLQLALVTPGDIAKTMDDISNRAGLMRVAILGDLVTAVGIIWLGVMLFLTLRRVSEWLALTGFALYVLEAVLIAGSKMTAFSLLQISQEFVADGRPAYLVAVGSAAVQSMTFEANAALLPFGIGAVLFYYLLYRSRVIPAALSIWGLASVSLVLLATVSYMAGYRLPIAMYIPYVPFEFVVGLWLAVKGARRNLQSSGA